MAPFLYPLGNTLLSDLMATLQLHASRRKSTPFYSTNLGIASSFKPIKVLCALNSDNAESSVPASTISLETAPDAQPGPIDHVKLAFSKAKAYKESLNSNPNPKIEQKATEILDKKANGKVGPNSGQNVDGEWKEVPLSAKIAMEMANKYKNNNGVVVGDNGAGSNEMIQGLQGGSDGTLQNDTVDPTRYKKGELSISRIDFMRLDFADKKKTSGLPPGLVPIADPFSGNELPEVELIVEDAGKFDAATVPETEHTKEDELEIYKPKVSTWVSILDPAIFQKQYGI